MVNKISRKPANGFYSGITGTRHCSKQVLIPLFFRREEKLYVEGMEDEDMKKETQNLAYPPAFKLEVALFAKTHSQYAAAKIFNVARRRIFDWMRQIPKLEELIAKGHMKKMTGRGPKNRDIDQALYSWYCERQGTLQSHYFDKWLLFS